MRRPFPCLLALSVLGCAGGQTAGAAAASTERQKVVNLVPFDFSTCSPAKLDLGKTANEYTPQAAFRASRPAIMECLADARNLKPSGPTKGTVSIVIDQSGSTVKVNGDGVPPATQACIEKAVRTELGNLALRPGAKPVNFEGPFDQDPASAVRFGVNESSDALGTIRLALPQMCSCFEPARTQAPAPLKGNVQIVREPKSRPADGGTVSPTGVTSTLLGTDPAGGPVASCLNPRIEALALKTTSDTLTFPAELLLVNSNATADMVSTAVPQIQFSQLDGVRELRQAEAYAALTRRQQVADTYDDLVGRYQTGSKSKDPKQRKAANALVKDLTTTCAALVKADDEFTAALEVEKSVEQRALDLAQSLKAKDPSWADAERASTAAVAETQKQIDSSKALRTANEKVCPKMKF